MTCLLKMRRSVILLVFLLWAASYDSVLLFAQASSPWDVAVKLTVKRRDEARAGNSGTSRHKAPLIRKAPILESVSFADERNGWAVGSDGVIAHTEDGGNEWSQRIVSRTANLTGVVFANAYAGWIVGSDTLESGKHVGIILHTEDGGATWVTQIRIEGYELSGLTDIKFVDQQRGWAVGAVQQQSKMRGIILVTENGGRDWSVQYLADERRGLLESLDFANAQRGWAVGENIILHTGDGGKHWREQRYDPDAYFFGVDFISPTEGWVVGGDGALLHTTDGGSSWKTNQLPTKYQSLWLAGVGFYSSTRGWVAGDDGAIFSTKNGGKTWTLESIGTSEFLRSLTSTPRGVYAVGNDGVILRQQLRDLPLGSVANW